MDWRAATLPSRYSWGMTASKQAVLAGAAAALNHPNQPWEVVVQGDSIVAHWRWMDATFFSPAEVNDAVKQYTFAVTLSDHGTWKEHDTTEEKSSGVSFSGGKLSFGSSTKKFSGHTTQKSFSLGVGRDNQTGQVGVVGNKFDTSAVKNPIRNYLTANGWKKAGLFG